MIKKPNKALIRKKLDQYDYGMSLVSLSDPEREILNRRYFKYVNKCFSVKDAKNDLLKINNEIQNVILKQNIIKYTYKIYSSSKSNNITVRLMGKSYFSDLKLIKMHQNRIIYVKKIKDMQNKYKQEAKLRRKKLMLQHKKREASKARPNIVICSNAKAAQSLINKLKTQFKL